MVNFREALGDAARSAFCGVSGAVAATLDLGGYIYRSAGGEFQGDDLSASAQLLRNVRNVACSVPLDVIPPPPFSGGQCVGDQYEVFVSRNGGTPTQELVVDPADGGGPIFGPVQPVEEFVNGFGLFDYFFSSRDGRTTVATNFSAPQNFVITQVNNLTNPGVECGNPGPTINPYEPANYTTTIPINYDDETGTPRTETPTFTVRPFAPDTGDGLSVPISIDFPDGTSLDADFNLSTGDVSIGIGLPGGSGVPDGQVQPLPDPGGPDGDVPTFEESQGLPIVAVFVRSVVNESQSQASDIPGPTPSDRLWIPRIASVNFHCEIGDGRGLAWTVDQSVKLESQIIPCIIPWGARSVRVTAEDGVTLQFVPLRGQTLQDQIDRLPNVPDQ